MQVSHKVIPPFGTSADLPRPNDRSNVLKLELKNEMQNFLLSQAEQNPRLRRLQQKQKEDSNLGSQNVFGNRISDNNHSKQQPNLHTSNNNSNRSLPQQQQYQYPEERPNFSSAPNFGKFPQEHQSYNHHTRSSYNNSPINRDRYHYDDSSRYPPPRHNYENSYLDQNYMGERRRSENDNYRNIYNGDGRPNDPYAPRPMENYYHGPPSPTHYVSPPRMNYPENNPGFLPPSSRDYRNDYNQVPNTTQDENHTSRNTNNCNVNDATNATGWGPSSNRSVLDQANKKQEYLRQLDEQVRQKQNQKQREMASQQKVEIMNMNQEIASPWGKVLIEKTGRRMYNQQQQQPPVPQPYKEMKNPTYQQYIESLTANHPPNINNQSPPRSNFLEQLQSMAAVKDDVSLNYPASFEAPFNLNSSSPVSNAFGQTLAIQQFPQQNNHSATSSHLNNPPSQQISYSRGQANFENLSSWQRDEVLQKQKQIAETQFILKQQIAEKEAEKARQEAQRKLEEEREQLKLLKDQELLKERYKRELEEAKKAEEEARIENEKAIQLKKEKERLMEEKYNQAQNETILDKQKKRRGGNKVLDIEVGNENHKMGEEFIFRSNSPPVPTLQKKNKEEVKNNEEIYRSNSPPIPTVKKKLEEEANVKRSKTPEENHFRSNSPPIPALRNKGEKKKEAENPVEEKRNREESVKINQKKKELKVEKPKEDQSAVLQQLLNIQKELLCESEKVQTELKKPISPKAFEKKKKIEDLNKKSFKFIQNDEINTKKKFDQEEKEEEFKVNYSSRKKQKEYSFFPELDGEELNENDNNKLFKVDKKSLNELLPKTDFPPNPSPIPQESTKSSVLERQRILLMQQEKELEELRSKGEDLFISEKNDANFKKNKNKKNLKEEVLLNDFVENFKFQVDEKFPYSINQLRKDVEEEALISESKLIFSRKNDEFNFDDVEFLSRPSTVGNKTKTNLLHSLRPRTFDSVLLNNSNTMNFVDSLKSEESEFKSRPGSRSSLFKEKNLKLESDSSLKDLGIGRGGIDLFPN
ncbi:hypothetical protein HK099_004358 [Clydaea vesicula]|uniref:Uncharacterized protein n=1 Tax=Clydaea vesicula TaxID=447962 RepID=A0AAD5XVP7_9FUNG|nr:hypothetical protein HK099_004358 [Clydaea vesicula]